MCDKEINAVKTLSQCHIKETPKMFVTTHLSSKHSWARWTGQKKKNLWTFQSYWEFDFPLEAPKVHAASEDHILRRIHTLPQGLSWFSCTATFPWYYITCEPCGFPNRSYKDVCASLTYLVMFPSLARIAYPFTAKVLSTFSQLSCSKRGFLMSLVQEHGICYGKF